MSRYEQGRDRTCRVAALFPRRLDNKAARTLEEGFSSSHAICEFMLAQLEQTLDSGLAAGIFNIEFNLTDASVVDEFRALPTDQVLAWLKANEHAEHAFELTYKSLCHALARDLLEFSTVAVNSAKAGLFTPAFANLRKPFKENLFYLEWILADVNEFMSRFSSGDIEKLKLKPLKEPAKLDIITRAVERIAYRAWVPPQLLYDLRFNKMSPISLEPVWQKANHLITTQGAMLLTEPENFNFVFSSAADRNSQRRWFYGAVPVLIFHALQIIEALIAMFARRSEPDLIPLRTAVGMFLWMRSAASYFSLGVAARQFRRIVVGTTREIRCPKCGRRFPVTIPNLQSLFDSSTLHCSRCQESLSLHVDY